MRPLDDKDREIISYLQYDGRMPYTDIAAEMGFSEGAVRRRVKRLINDGVLQIVGIVDPQFLDWQAAGMIGVSVQAGQIDAAAQQICDRHTRTVRQRLDLFIEVYCRDREHFVSFLSDKLQKVPGVERTETFMILKMYKLSYRWGEAEPPRQVKRLP